MGSDAPPRPPKNFWGDAPDEAEYYLSQGVRNGHQYFTTPHGRLFTQSFRPVDSTGELLPVKGLVFMTHGYGSDSGWLFQKIAINFSTWGYAVHCADLLGHGRSDGVRGYVGDMEAVAAASLSFFLHVRNRHPALPAFLFGESMGGAATLLMYLRAPPGAFTGLMFSAPLFVIPEPMKPSRVRLFLYGLLFGLADTWAILPDNKIIGKAIKDPDLLRVIASNPRRYTGPPRVGTMRELTRLCEYLQERFGAVTAPFIVAHGVEDGVAEPEGAKMLYEKAASEDKEIVLYEGMYHSLIQGEPEQNSSRVLGNFRRWIDERVKRYGNGHEEIIGDGEEENGKVEKMTAGC